jgi:hypothetical protein
VSPVKYELGLYIPDDAILHSHCRENLKSYLGWECFQASRGAYGFGVSSILDPWTHKGLNMKQKYQPFCCGIEWLAMSKKQDGTLRKHLSAEYRRK